MGSESDHVETDAIRYSQEIDVFDRDRCGKRLGIIPCAGLRPCILVRVLVQRSGIDIDHRERISMWRSDSAADQKCVGKYRIKTMKSKRIGRPKKEVSTMRESARESIAALVDANAGRCQEWLDKVAAEQGPAAALRCYTDLIEFHLPRLARREYVGEDGGAVELIVKWEDQ